MLKSLDIVQTIIREVAEYENVPPDDLPPVEDMIPIDVRYILADEQADRSETLHFTYLWYQITVQPSGAVTVEP